MLIEKFDLLELLRLCIANNNGKGKVTKDVVLGEIATLSNDASLWAGLLVQNVDFERIAIITPPEKQTELFISRYDFNYQYERRVEDIPGKVEFTQGQIRSGDFFRVRNKLASKLHKEMIKNKFKPNNAQGDLVNIAKGLAEIVLRGKMFTKAMCGACQGLGKLEKYNNKGFPNGSKFCEKCDGSGKRPYTINEKMKIAGLCLTKAGYKYSYERYELLGESIVAQWENQIRGKLARSFRIDTDEVKILEA